jgi:glycosyltransferase involved in cell wall biosynthesis
MDNKVKIVCLTPIKNEAWILRRFLSCTSQWADKIILADQNSTDESLEIARSFPKVHIVSNRGGGYSEIDRQQLLVQEARRESGQKLLMALDADEILSGNFITSLEWRAIKDAAPGTAIFLRWANLSPEGDHYGSSYPMQFGYMDDGAKHTGGVIHSTRLPPPKGPELLVQGIRVLHFQYIDWERTQSKHRWYQCWEKINRPWLGPVNIFRIYNHLPITRASMIHKIPSDWLSYYETLGIDMRSIFRNSLGFWWDKEVAAWFRELGPHTFRKQNIWYLNWCEHLKRSGIEVENGWPGDPRSITDKVILKLLQRTQHIKDRFHIRILDKVIQTILWR